MRGKITKRSVEAIKPLPSKDVVLWDTEAKGFGVRVKPSGIRSFVLSYYAPGLHQVKRRLTIGTFGPLTVDQARRQAQDLLARIAVGEDPAQQVVAERRSVREETVAALFPVYLDEARGRKTKSTLDYYRSLGKLHILPHLGRIPVATVSGKHVSDLHRSLIDRRVTGNRVVQLVRSFFNWLKRRKVFVGENPAAHVDRYSEQARERFLNEEEMARLGQALRAAETVGLTPAPQHRKKASNQCGRNSGMFSSEKQPANPVSVAALRFLMITGWREQEALSLRWDAVNMDNGNATLSDTKSGKSVRPLAAPAMAIIAAQPHVTGSHFVFPGRIQGKPIREIQRLWYAVRHAANLEGVRLHDLRHSVASTAGTHGYSIFQISQLLGHKDPRSTLRYAHISDSHRKAMADDVGNMISRAMNANEIDNGVITLPLANLKGIEKRA